MIQVKPGDIVKEGQCIGKSGNTGIGTGPHVHLTIRKGRYKGKTVNPDQYIVY